MTVALGRVQAPPIDDESDRRRKAAEVLARRMLEDASAEGLRPGDQLIPEAQMIKLYGAGRASVREALRILETHGVVSIRPGRGGGPVLQSLRGREVASTFRLYFQQRKATYGHVLDARLEIEPCLARLAAERCDREARERVLTALRSFLDASPKDHHEVAVGAHRLHLALSVAADNPVLSTLSIGLRDLYSWKVHTWFVEDSYWRPTRNGMQVFAEQVVSGDAAGAEAAQIAINTREFKFARKHFPEVLTETVHWE
jgi:GntR family transcriptional regulator, transcriptional repressor for pyruvate dehydrogenase complex